jgi:hypothetical protein
MRAFRRNDGHLLRLTRTRAVIVATAGLILAGLIAFIAIAAGSGQSSHVARSTIGGFGLSMQLPPGWNGRVYRPSPADAITLEAATVPLAPTGDSSFEQTERAMGAGDAYIRLSDIGAPPSYLGREHTWQRVSLPISIDAGSVQRFVEGQSLPANVVRPLVIKNRAITLYVGFGSAPSPAAIRDVDHVLASLSVAAS